MNPKQLMKLLGVDEIITLDFETYFNSKGYSLRSQKMSTSEYVRDERFKSQCVGIRSTKMRKARWFHADDIAKELLSIDWSSTALLCHNTAFDGFILSQIYGIVPAYYLDTLSMARPLFSHNIGAGLDEVAKYLGYAGKVRADALGATKDVRDLPWKLMKPLGMYCADDVDDTWNIFKEMLKVFPYDEILQIHITINAFANPVAKVDLPLVEEELAFEIEKKRKLFLKCARTIGIPANIRGKDRQMAVATELKSNDKFAAILRGIGIEPPLKPSPTPGKGPIFAFAKNDLDFQALEHHSRRDVREVIEARIAAKSAIGETRAKRMLLRGTTGDCRLPLMLNYGKAHTLRWSGGDKFNPQNFPRGGRLRKAIIAPEGYRIVVVDSSQIEARVNAWLWNQEDLLHLFATGQDPYKALAQIIYGVPLDQITYEQRFVGKVGILGLGYGMGAEKFQNTLAVGAMGPAMNISIQEAEKVKSVFRRTNYKIVAGWRTLESMLGIMMNENLERDIKDILHFYHERVDTPSGFTMHYKDLRASINPRTDRYQDFNYAGQRGARVHIYGGKFNENVVQHLARLVVGHQMLDIATRYRVINMTHDEVVYLAHWREADTAFEYGLRAMRTPPPWCSDIPLDAEGGYAINYSK